MNELGDSGQVGSLLIITASRREWILLCWAVTTTG